MKKFDFGQLAYQFAHPVSAFHAGMAKDMDKYSKGNFDYASFDAQVFGKQNQAVPDHNRDASHLRDCELAQDAMPMALTRVRLINRCCFRIIINYRCGSLVPESLSWKRCRYHGNESADRTESL